MGARVAFLSDAKSDDQQSHAAAPTSVTVPTEAILANGDQAVVFVVRENRVERRAVKLGERVAQGQIILSGLSSSETVALIGLDKLADGTKVQIEK
jgi:multidrug efflux pump subunit AcrA (membrane-fusion protein)